MEEDDEKKNNQQSSKQNLEKKKIKVLKKALKEERAIRAEIEQELALSKQKIDQLNYKVSEEEKKYLQIYQENINLQEALMSESSTNKILKQRSTVATPTQRDKPILLVNGLLDKAPSSQNKQEKQQQQQQESNDKKQQQQSVETSQQLQINQETLRSYEEQLLKKENELQKAFAFIDEQKQESFRMQMIFDQKLSELVEENEKLKEDVQKRENENEELKNSLTSQFQNKLNDYEGKIKKIVEENAQLIEQKNSEVDKNLKLMEEIDKKQEQIVNLEKENLKTNDEVNLRKEIINSMSQSLLRHEEESKQLAENLVTMKNQIIESDIGKSLKKVFAAVKLGRLKNIPTFITFAEYGKNNFFIHLSTKHGEISINIKNLESIKETKEGNINIIYYLRDEQNTNKMQKKNQIFECMENKELIQTFEVMRQKYFDSFNSKSPTKQGSTKNINATFEIV